MDKRVSRQPVYPPAPTGQPLARDRDSG